MGVVYLAHNRMMGRDEVLKVMSRHIVDRPGVLDRFLREIRSAARLQHPNIVTAYSARRIDWSIVFAMEYVDGLDLVKMVKAKGPLPVAHAAYFAHQVALGLQHEHEHGMVHRDIKPGNLMLARKGVRAAVKILDFGLAKVGREEPVDGSLTAEGQMLGTPDYIAPEQTLDAQKADIRADIYSLGCTLYYLLSAQAPFRGKSLYDILQAHHSIDARPLNLVRPEVPVELAVVIGKLMAKDPDRRFQTLAGVAKTLSPFFKAGAVEARKPRSTFASPTTPDPVPVAYPPNHSSPAFPIIGAPAPDAVESPEEPPAWNSLIEFKVTERSQAVEPLKAFATAGRAGPTRRRLRPSGIIAVGFLAVLALGVVSPADNVPGEDFAPLATTEMFLLEGEYHFLLHGDEAARLLIDGVEVSGNGKDLNQADGQRRQFVVPLKKGKHKFRVEHRENGYLAILILQMRRP